MPHPVDVHVGKKLRQRREIHGMPQKLLARLLGISFQQVQKYESGVNRVSASKLWEVSSILGVEPGYFFEGLSHKPDQEKTPVAMAAAQEGLESHASESTSARQVLDLNKNFQQIRDIKVRRHLLQIVKSLAK